MTTYHDDAPAAPAGPSLAELSDRELLELVAHKVSYLEGVVDELAPHARRAAELVAHPLAGLRRGRRGVPNGR